MINLEAVDRPSKHAIKCFRTWLDFLQEKWPTFMPSTEATTWLEPGDLEDLLAIQADRSLRDPFDEKVSRSLIGVYDFLFQKREKRPSEDANHSQKMSVQTSEAPAKKNSNRPQENPDEIIKDLRVYRKVKWVGMVTAFLAALVGALIPILSILGLFHIKSTPKRIYTLIGLTVVFALAVKLLSGARTIDLFAVTAA